MVIVKIVEPNMNTKYLIASSARIDVVTKNDIYLRYKIPDYRNEQAIYLNYNTKYVSLIINDVEYLHSKLLTDYDKINALLEEKQIEDAIDTLP